MSLYDDNFYASQGEGAYRSAKILISYLASLTPFASVADLGCGRGNWLKACLESGVERVVGIDGSWNSGKMVDSRVHFQVADLNGPLAVDTRFDLAMSLEVAEHLEPGVSEVFVASLCSMSDIVLFGAAYPGQGGRNHVNEKPGSFWAKLFLAQNYLVFDVVRPKFWGDQRIPFWYRQNTFLYVKQDSDVVSVLKAKGFQPLEELSFMDCVHPDLLEMKLHPPSFVSALEKASSGLHYSFRNFGRAVARVARR